MKLGSGHIRSDFEVVRPVDIGNERSMCWPPAQKFLRSLAGSRAVDANEMRHPAKVTGCLLGRLTHNRDIQAPANNGRDLPERHALIGDSVVPGPRGTLLHREPVKASG